MPHKKVDGVFIDGSVPGKQFVLCARCGQREEISLPLRISVYLFLLKEFAGEHADCLPKKEEASNGSTP